MKRQAQRCSTYLKKSVAAPLMLMYFSMLFINTILRDTKDTLLVTLSTAGVESIPFIKTYLVIPSSMLFFLFYSKLAKTYKPHEVFIRVLIGFCVFYIAFTAFLFPNMTRRMSETKQNSFQEEEKSELNLAVFLNEWPLALFFVASELWASCVCQVLFWQTANDALTVTQAREVYPLIGAMGNLGMVFAGQFLFFLANERDYLISAKAYLRIPHDHQQAQLEYWLYPFEQNPIVAGWIETLTGICAVLVISCVLNAYLLDVASSRRFSAGIKMETDTENKLSRSLSFPQRNNQGRSSKKDKFSKPSLSLRESLLTLSMNEGLRTCAILVVSYGISSCLVEVTWKAEVKRTYQAANEYSKFMAQFWFYTGIVSMFFMVLGRYILPLKKYGYRISVLFTPLIEVVAGTLFYFTGYHRVSNSAYVGAFLVMTAKSAKYAFFDTSKELIFISLGPEARSIGKAAIELVCYRLAKSGGSFYLQLIIFFTGKVNSKRGLILSFCCFICVCSYWTKVACKAERFVKDNDYVALPL